MDAQSEIDVKKMSKPCDGTPSGKINGLLAKNPVAILIHVTDTYFIEESRVNGITDLPGFARFCSLIESIRTNPTVQKNKIPVLVLHGGDFLYPSLMSIYFQGRQMVDVMNMCGFDYCTLGNHDFDGGIDSLKERISEASFEITCANIKNPKKEDILKISDYVICHDENNKPYAAITGVAGKATLRKAEQNGFAITDTNSSLSQTITNIKNNHPQINHLIILSHMGNEEDIKLERWLGRNWGGFLYLLGGHDHNEVMQYSSKSPKAILLKGQSNCRTVQVVGIPKYFDLKNSRQIPEHVVVINSAELSEFHPDFKMQECVKRWETDLEEYLNEQKSDRVVKRFKKSIVLDATELQLRKGSTNFGNFIADCILDFTESDIAFINSGHFRGDRKIGSILRLSDLRRVFVLDKKDTLVKITMTQKECVKFLRYAYSEEGRGKILQTSKNAIKILHESQPEDILSVTMLWDMLKTNDDGFATILAQSRKTTVNSITSKLKKYIIPDSSLFYVVEESSKHTQHDPSMRISVEKFSDILTQG